MELIATVPETNIDIKIGTAIKSLWTDPGTPPSREEREGGHGVEVSSTRSYPSVRGSI
jgi:hypothetical protein